MSPGRRWLLAVFAAAAAVLLATMRADAQIAPHIELVSQTSIVGDEPATIDVRIIDPPDGSRLEVRIHTPVTTRDEVRATYDDPPDPTANLVSQFSRPLETIAVEGSADLYSITIPDEEVGEVLRRDPGALPVVIQLAEGDRTLDTLVTHLLVVDDPPVEEGDQPIVRVTFVTDLRADLAHRPDQSVAPFGDELTRHLELIDSLPRASVALALRPETLSALEAIGGPGALDPVVDVVRGRTVLLEPWVALDEEAWRQAGESAMVIAQYARGRSTVEELVEVSPTAVARLDPDAGRATLGLLRVAGTTRVLVDRDSVAETSIDEAADQPIHLLDDNGVPMVALLFDERLARTLDDNDPELGAYRALAELRMIAANATEDRAVVVDLATISLDAIGTLVDVMVDHDDLRASPLASLFDTSVARSATGSIVEARLVPDDPPDMSASADELRRARADVDAYAGMVTSTDAPIVPLRTLLLVSADEALADSDRLAYTSAATEAVTRGVSGIVIVESERITLATRTADLPVMIRNEQSLPITVDLVLRGEKLRFPDGDRRTIELEPGDNQLTVRVEARASGDARVTATLISPDGRLQLHSEVILVRSTALSGIGLLISAAALSVLLVWWIRTVRRTRRARSAATVPASADNEAVSAPRGPGDQGSREEP